VAVGQGCTEKKIGGGGQKRCPEGSYGRGEEEGEPNLMNKRKGTERDHKMGGGK